MFLVKFLILIIIFSILFMQLNKKGKGKIRLNLANFFLIALFAYIIEPLFEVLINNEISAYNESFLNDAIVMTLCILIGTILGLKRMNIKHIKFKCSLISNCYKNYSSVSEFIRLVSASILCLSFVIIHIIINRGGFGNYFSSGYSDIRGIEVNNNIASLIFSTIAYAIVFNNKDIIKKRNNRYLAHFITIIFFLIFLFGGNRNYAIMILFGMLFVIFKNKDFKLISIGICTFAGIILMGVIAVFREYGFTNIISNNTILNINDIFKYVFNFRNGELGTTMNFSKYVNLIGSDFKFPYSFGYSYFILPIINLIPRMLWNDKPLVYADYFSKFAFGYSDGIGFGFSPIYEAKINLGLFWGIVFIVIGYFLMRLNINANEKSSNIKIQLLCATISSIILNFFRIDFSTCFKFFIMIWCFAILFFNVAVKRIRINGNKF